ncbi:hypothetical protein PCK1_000750 [Pneumocystis canis]|nr:hypothetical protein PCK1_000750 [Pneumocystis canis]
MSLEYIGAIDQGTTSSRFFLFDKNGSITSFHQHEFTQIYPQPGWIEHDPLEILDSVNICIEKAIEEFVKKGFSVRQIRAVGIANQRETIVVWNKITGKPLYNAIVWLDTRAIGTVCQLSQKEGASEIHEKCGLPISTYFSAVKLRWLLDNSESVREVYDQGNLVFGTIDSWIIYNLTGGINGGIHITDVTNASRTMLLNIKTLQYDESLINFFGFEKLHLPDIRFSSEKPVYALEGSIAVAGSAIKWFRDKMNIISTVSEIDQLAASVEEDSAGVVFVTAFSGLFAPYWYHDARGTIFGITNYTTKEHIARSILEAICFQTKAVLDAMDRDSGSSLKSLKVDGGITNSDICMQIQSDIIGIDVYRPEMREVTALGSAIAAGLAVGVWKDIKELEKFNSGRTTVFSPKIDHNKRKSMFDLWEKAVRMSLGWEIKDS